MNKKVIIESWRHFKQPLLGEPAGLRKLAPDIHRSLLDKLQEMAGPAIAKLDPAEIDIPENLVRYNIVDKHYIMPAVITAIFRMMMSAPQPVHRIIVEVAAEFQIPPDSVLDLFARYFTQFLFLRRMELKPYTQYAVSDPVWDRVSGLGNVEKFRIEDVVAKIEGTHMFYRETGELCIIYPTLYSGDGKIKKVVKVELYYPQQKTGSAFLDVYQVDDPAVTTIGELIDWYAANGHILETKEDDKGAFSRNIAKYLNLMWLISCDNMIIPKPVEFNETRERLLNEGKKSQAGKHQSYKFVDYSAIRYKYTEKKTASEPTGRSVKAHLRSEHIHGYWVGPKNDPEKRMLVTRFIPTLLVKGGGGDPTDNRVFKTLDNFVK